MPPTALPLSVKGRLTEAPSMTRAVCVVAGALASVMAAACPGAVAARAKIRRGAGRPRACSRMRIGAPASRQPTPDTAR